MTSSAVLSAYYRTPGSPHVIIKRDPCLTDKKRLKENQCEENNLESQGGFPSLAITRDTRTAPKRLRTSSNFPELERSTTFHAVLRNGSDHIKLPSALDTDSMASVGFVPLTQKPYIPSTNDQSKEDHSDMKLPQDLPRWKNESHRSQRQAPLREISLLGIEPPKVSQGFWKAMKLTPGEIQLTYHKDSKPSSSQTTSPRRNQNDLSAVRPTAHCSEAMSVNSGKLSSQSRTKLESLTKVTLKDKDQDNNCPACKAETYTQTATSEPRSSKTKKSVTINPVSFICTAGQDNEDPDRLNDVQIEKFLQKQLEESRKQVDRLEEGNPPSNDEKPVKAHQPPTAIQLALKAARRNRKIEKGQRSWAGPEWRGPASVTPSTSARTFSGSPISQIRITLPYPRGGVTPKRRDPLSYKYQSKPINSACSTSPLLSNNNKSARYSNHSSGKDGLCISRSLALYNMSLPLENDNSRLCSSIAGKHTFSSDKPFRMFGSLPKDWRSQFTPQQWVQLLRANPGDHIFKTLGLEKNDMVCPSGYQPPRTPIRLPTIATIDDSICDDGDEEIDEECKKEPEEEKNISSFDAKNLNSPKSNDNPSFNAPDKCYVPCNSPEIPHAEMPHLNDVTLLAEAHQDHSDGQSSPDR